MKAGVEATIHQETSHFNKEDSRSDALREIEELRRSLQSAPSIEAETELLILRARIDGEQVYVEALNDRLKWNRYPHSIQDQAIAMVDRRLEEAFSFQSTEVYECAGISHRIATFEHVKSGALLNLIPGGTYQMGSPESEVGRREREGPIHEVMIKPMLMGRYQVRQSVWDRIGGDDERRWTGSNLPIDSVSWDNVKAW